jgi:peptidoglycan/LPS O-acetylase OafA/YrhL
VKSVGVLLALPFLSTLVIKPNRFTRFITFISLISYSMYLVNLKVVLYMIMKNGIYQQFEGRWQLHENWWLDYLMFWGFTIAISYTIYKLVEVPFMNMRKADK